MALDNPFDIVADVDAAERLRVFGLRTMPADPDSWADVMAALSSIPDVTLLGEHYARFVDDVAGVAFVESWVTFNYPRAAQTAYDLAGIAVLYPGEPPLVISVQTLEPPVRLTDLGGYLTVQVVLNVLKFQES